ncbi:hypothetical protein MAPG_01501 [Magnaporthiopsis poae ATCC 64411]|uniref:Uncharacterized protein n=1 Tax=Magnaporthiopsis poae (strain ATCC 64411 / 73-15) TaxID=644358 RepID=A0A0C4DNV4_MAGP6|nr:hypothetical protein MAPG_01501 [Magnaporthiopsis poae ATCC 64411]
MRTQAASQPSASRNTTAPRPGAKGLFATPAADRPIQTIEGSAEPQQPGSSDLGLGLGSTGASYMPYGDGGLMGSGLGGSLYAAPSFRVAGTGTLPEVIGSIPAVTTAAAGTFTGLFDIGFGSDTIGAPALGSGYDLPAGLLTSTSNGGGGAYGTSALTGGLTSSAA